MALIGPDVSGKPAPVDPTLAAGMGENAVALDQWGVFFEPFDPSVYHAGPSIRHVAQGETYFIAVYSTQEQPGAYLLGMSGREEFSAGGNWREQKSVYDRCEVGANNWFWSMWRSLVAGGLLLLLPMAGVVCFRRRCSEETGDHADNPRTIVVGAGIGGLTAGALLLQAGHDVTVLEGQVYPGGSAGTFYRKGYRFDAGATLAGGFSPGGPHARVAEILNLDWPVRSVDPAWQVHLPGGRTVTQWADQAEWQHEWQVAFPETGRFWRIQEMLADISLGHFLPSHFPGHPLPHATCHSGAGHATLVASSTALSKHKDSRSVANT